MSGCDERFETDVRRQKDKLMRLLSLMLCMLTWFVLSCATATTPTPTLTPVPTTTPTPTLTPVPTVTPTPVPTVIPYSLNESTIRLQTHCAFGMVQLYQFLKSMYPAVNGDMTIGNWMGSLDEFMSTEDYALLLQWMTWILIDLVEDNHDRYDKPLAQCFEPVVHEEIFFYMVSIKPEYAMQDLRNYLWK